MSAAPSAGRPYDLGDRYKLEAPRFVASGTQTLVRLMLAQAAADRRAGLNTAGFVSGYRGSPLGAVDLEFWKAAKATEAAGVRFQPAINEDLAATAILGTQRLALDPERKVDGVFALWYGKGPGVDRSGDALKHGNAYGSSPLGGVVVVLGDDHGSVSSSMPHQSDDALMAWSMPVIHPASIGEYVDFGLWGFSASRASGAWIGMKAVSEVVESAGTIEAGPPPAFAPIVPPQLPPGGLHVRWPDLPGRQIEQRLAFKLDAIRAFARANPLDRLVVAPATRKRLIVTVGKAHGDVMEVFRVAGLGGDALAQAGLAILKLGLVYPLEPEGILAAAEGVSDILVVEEKRGIVERQLKELFYNRPDGQRPAILGKTDALGAPLVARDVELRPSTIASVLASFVAPLGLALAIPEAWRIAARREAGTARGPVRTPYFCSGCPHSTSTHVPEGSEARAGIGCHFMANWMDRSTTGIVQMGGEGVDWVGQAPFTRKPHIFQNLGDGTFFHSGLLAIRQAIAAKVDITFKILFNDAVAMTGGQPVDGTLTVRQIARLAAAEGASTVAVVSDRPELFSTGVFPAGTTIDGREDLDTVQRRLRDIPGVTVLIYEQTCAAEKRRRRKRGLMPDPPRRVFINERVCEGCGDCQAKSNCLSVVPVETAYGRKRAIDQSSCNKDFSCVNGFCPSFVAVEGGRLRQRSGIADEELSRLLDGLPEPRAAELDKPFQLLVAGIGGTGVVTLGALAVMAAHLDGHAASALDFTGFAQKGGPVLSHVRIARDQEMLHQLRIDRGEADAVIACDLVVATMPEAAGVLRFGGTRIVANPREIQTGAMLRDPDSRIDTASLEAQLRRLAGPENLALLDADRLADRLIGDRQQANILLLGAAFQRRLLPVSLASLHRAIELNGVAVEKNRRAFGWGRVAGGDPQAVEALLGETSPPRDLDDIIKLRVADLTAYQNAPYAARYAERVAAVRRREADVFGKGAEEIATAVAKNLYRLMAIKDEYEVARLYADPAFRVRLAAEFEGDLRLTFHLAPPLLARPRPGASEPRKIAFGPWIERAFGMLARFKSLRGTWLDPFARAAERRSERALLAEYEAMLDEMLPRLTAQNRAAFLALCRLPESIRGFGPVKERAMAKAAVEREALLARFESGGGEALAA